MKTITSNSVKQKGKRAYALLIALWVPCAWLAPMSVTHALGTTDRVSVDSFGLQGDDQSHGIDLSHNGRYVAFSSTASNLVASDTNAVSDIFVHDRETGETTRVSINAGGEQANGPSFSPVLSADGRYVAFESDASNLVANDTENDRDVFVRDNLTGEMTLVSIAPDNGKRIRSPARAFMSGDGRYVGFTAYDADKFPLRIYQRDVFLHDRQAGETTQISVGVLGAESDGDSTGSAISDDGRYVAFTSNAHNISPIDGDGAWDVYIHDRTTGQNRRASVNSLGEEVDEACFSPALSADGRYVVFQSDASTLVPTPWWNSESQIFLHDMLTGQTTRISRDPLTRVGRYGARASSISADGRYVAFQSDAGDLVLDDTNRDTDIFVYDRQTGDTVRVSTDSLGAQANEYSSYASISGDGRSVGFQSIASNLVAGDTNGKEDVFVHQLLPALIITTQGTGSGNITSFPAGIDCGEACRAEFPRDTRVGLTVTTHADSLFKGWSGNADCVDGLVTLAASVRCTATFALKPTIGVRAPDAVATEAGPTTGKFTFTRSGNTASALTIRVNVAGTAIRGTDYVSLGSRITFPMGARSVTRIVRPINDALRETNETVVLKLVSSSNYLLGTYNRATVFIKSNE